MKVILYDFDSLQHVSITTDNFCKYEAGTFFEVFIVSSACAWDGKELSGILGNNLTNNKMVILLPKNLKDQFGKLPEVRKAFENQRLWKTYQEVPLEEEREEELRGILSKLQRTSESETEKVKVLFSDILDLSDIIVVTEKSDEEVTGNTFISETKINEASATTIVPQSMVHSPNGSNVDNKFDSVDISSDRKGKDGIQKESELEYIDRDVSHRILTVLSFFIAVVVISLLLWQMTALGEPKDLKRSSIIPLLLDKAKNAKDSEDQEKVADLCELAGSI
ncbi:MAG: hypothetical protein BWK78_05640, partial [Thiotrichaceae bacterium IS1]